MSFIFFLPTQSKQCYIQGSNNPLEKRMKNPSDYLENEVLDVICFQEITPTNGVPQIDRVLKDNGYSYEYTMSGQWKSRKEGLAITYKYKIIDFASFKLPCKDAWNDMQRILGACEKSL